MVIVALKALRSSLKDRLQLRSRFGTGAQSLQCVRCNLAVVLLSAILLACAAPVLDAEPTVQPVLPVPMATDVPAVVAATVQPTQLVRPAPSAAATPLVSSVPVAVVTTNSLNARAYPGIEYGVVFVNPRDAVLYIAGPAAGTGKAWLPIYAVGKGYGWVAQRYVRLEQRLATGADYDIWLQHIHGLGGAGLPLAPPSTKVATTATAVPVVRLTATAVPRATATAKPTVLVATAPGGAGLPLNALIVRAAKDIEGFWSAQMRARGLRYRSPRVSQYQGSATTACGPAMEWNAYYCRADNSIGIHQGLAQWIYDEIGEFGVVQVLAHEWGHHIQKTAALTTIIPMFTELQADCLAGVYAQDAQERGILTADDLAATWLLALNAGDSLDTPWFDDNAHGNSVQRLFHFNQGYLLGEEACYAMF